MAKINISFNNKDYSIDEASLSPSADSLKNHLSTIMNGTGATIRFGGVAYNIDSIKLSAATNDFVTYLGTVSGDGYKVVVNGTEHNVASAKMTTAVSDLEVVLGGLISEGGDENVVAAGLYQTGAIALYNEQGADAIKDMLITSWDDLVASGAIVINNGVMSTGNVLPDLPEQNEYGFYFGVEYDGAIFYEDGSCYLNGTLMPAGTAVYGENSIDMSALGIGVVQVVDDGLALMFNNGGKVCLAKPAQFEGDLIISNDCGITELVSDAFADKQLMTGVMIPNGVTNIYEYAFYGCTSLTSVIIPDSVTTIESNAFQECTSLTSIIIPDSVASIGRAAFNGCTSLTSIIIPDSVTTIESLFTNCTSLTSIIIPDSVTTIEHNTFTNCTSLTSIIIPSSVAYIGQSAFSNCTSLYNIEFNGTVNEWRSIHTGQGWNHLVPATHVQCSDGTVTL